MEPALLDTDMLSELWKLRDPIVQQSALLYQSEHGAFAFSAMTRYEVLRGYRRHGAANQEARFEIFGSSPNSGESLADFEKEVVVVSVAVGHTFEDFDLVIDAFQQAGVQGPAAVGENALQTCFEVAGELL